MSSAYGKIERPKGHDAQKLQSILPIERRSKTNRMISIYSLTSLLENTEDLSELISYLRNLLNYEIHLGNTYPQKSQLTLSEFQNYFLVGDTFVALNGDKLQSKEFLNNIEENVLGTFYIKPNFPGRCSHICNGGFITADRHRNQGVGKIMALAFMDLVPILGYKASMFNLVFASNTASIRLWRSLNFQEIGRLPKAGLLKNADVDKEEEYVDAIMFYYDFDAKSK